MIQLKNYTIQMKNYENYANGKLQNTNGNYTMQMENYKIQLKSIKYRLNTIIQYKCKIYTLQSYKIKFCNVYFNWHALSTHTLNHLYAYLSYKRKYTCYIYHHEEIL